MDIKNHLRRFGFIVARERLELSFHCGRPYATIMQISASLVVSVPTKDKVLPKQPTNNCVHYTL